MTVTQSESSQPVADFKWGDVANTEKKQWRVFLFKVNGKEIISNKKFFIPYNAILKQNNI